MRTHKQQSSPQKHKRQKRTETKRAPKTPVGLQLAGASPQEMLQMQRLLGNRQTSALIQREASSPQGQAKKTEFGEYWIVPDNTTESYEADGEQIAETTFRQVEEMWNAFKDDSGQIVIDEKDAAGVAHNGFKAQVLERLGMLISGPVGRALLLRLMYEEMDTVTIRPMLTQQEVDEETITPVETDLVIELDPELKDERILAHEANGRPLTEPAYGILGYELLFAENHIDGSNKWAIPPTDPAFEDADTHAQLAGTSVGEILIRAETQRSK